MRFCKCWLLLVAIAPAAFADDWPQWRGPTRDGVWRESGIVEKFAKTQLDLVWRVDIAGGYSGPTVADGRVFVTDRVVEPKQQERVHCFRATDGKKLWTYAYDCVYRNVSYETGPRASVLVDGPIAYALGSMGHFTSFDAATGHVRWQKDLNREYKIRMPIWGIAASPVVEGDLIIVQIGGENDACLVAFDKKTGREVWKALEDNASYSAPRVIDQAGRRVLVCWTGERVVGVDPQTGKLYWHHPFKQRMIINIADPVLHRDMLFFSNFFDGSMLLKLERDRLAVTQVWRRSGEDEHNTDSLHSIISTPYLKGDYIYGVCSYGQLRCLDLMTGDRVWESLDAVPKARWATIHMVEHEGDIWMFNERGELIISRLSPAGFEEISRAKLITPTKGQLNRRGGVCWTHPAFAGGRVFVRNDKELVCADLRKR
jgi:outer membrane protein assembly factor BamB